MNPAEFVFESAETKPEKVSEILEKLHNNGESVSQILDFFQSAKKRMVSVDFLGSALEHKKIFDVCGTGGTGKKRINLSTALAIKLSQEKNGETSPSFSEEKIKQTPKKGGLKSQKNKSLKTFAIAKHGNRAASGKIGSFDLIESLGYEVGDTPESVRSQIEEKNLSFLFAPAFHPAFKALAPIRKNLGHPTVFNYLGPLLNPVKNLTAQMTGVSSPIIGQKLAEVCQHLKKNILFVYDKRFGLDDVSIGGQTQFWKIIQGRLETGYFDPEDFGLPRVLDFSEISGGDSLEANQNIFKNLLSGKATVAQMKFLEINERVARDFFQNF